jgi:hypothetical protein
MRRYATLAEGLSEAWFLLLSLKKGTMKEKPQTLRVELLGGFRVSLGSRTVG